jgi:MFS family permease
MASTPTKPNGSLHKLREFGGITLARAGAGLVIGAFDGAAMSMSFTAFDNEPGINKIKAALLWAIGACGLGAIIGVFVGVLPYYVLFSRQLSSGEFFQIATVSLIAGSAVCLVTERFLLEISWLATPVITILAAVALETRKRERKLMEGS